MSNYTNITTRAGKGSRLEHNVSTKRYREGYDGIFGKDFSRKCPSCGKVLTYSSKGGLARAIKEQRKCHECSRSRSWRENVSLGLLKRSHGLSHHPLYSCWQALMQRCHNPSCEGYENYGQRGISVCKLWQESPEAFLDWGLAHGWKEGLQIDRKNNDGNYEPENCRFVSSKVNNNNKRKDSEKVTCTNCDGFGEVPEGSTTIECVVCRGTGKFSLCE